VFLRVCSLHVKGGIRKLTEEAISNFFSQYGKIVSIEGYNLKKGFCFVIFHSSEVVSQLIQIRYFKIGDERVDLKEYNSPDPSSYWGKRNAKDEALLEMLETGPKAPKSILITEENKNRERVTISPLPIQSP